MEALVVVVILVLVLGVSVLRASNTRRSHLPERPDEPLPPLNLPRQSAFDARTAHYVPAKRVIRGRAYVTDGDTITIEGTQVRLFGIDAPELGHPFGQKAKWAMVRLCKGQIVQAEIHQVDNHGRTVAHCTLADGRDLSAELVKEGLAIDWPKYSGGRYRHLETPDARKKMWLADARQKGRMHVWEKFENGRAQR